MLSTHTATRTPSHMLKTQGPAQEGPRGPKAGSVGLDPCCVCAAGTKAQGRQKQGRASHVDSRAEGGDGDKGRTPPGVENRNHRFIADGRQELPASSHTSEWPWSGLGGARPPTNAVHGSGRSLGQLLCHSFPHLVLQVGTFLPLRPEFLPLVVRDLRGGRGGPGSAHGSAPAPLAPKPTELRDCAQGRCPTFLSAHSYRALTPAARDPRVRGTPEQLFNF